MELDEIRKKLEFIYSNYYAGRYLEDQLKQMLKILYADLSMEPSKWSELILDAQWKYAKEEDYKRKRNELDIEYMSRSKESGNMFFCNCGGLLFVEDIEKYPTHIGSQDKLNYERKCKAKCVECGKEYENLMYD